MTLAANQLSVLAQTQQPTNININIATVDAPVNSQHDPSKGGDDYYDVDLRNTNKPSIKKIDLATAHDIKGNGSSG